VKIIIILNAKRKIIVVIVIIIIIIIVINITDGNHSLQQAQLKSATGQRDGGHRHSNHGSRS